MNYCTHTLPLFKSETSQCICTNYCLLKIIVYSEKVNIKYDLISQ